MQANASIRLRESKTMKFSYSMRASTHIAILSVLLSSLAVWFGFDNTSKPNQTEPNNPLQPYSVLTYAMPFGILIYENRPAGLWPLASGLWPLASGLWPLASGLWPLASGLWPLASGLGPLGLWASGPRASGPGGLWAWASGPGPLGLGLWAWASGPLGLGLGLWAWASGPSKIGNCERTAKLLEDSVIIL
jgi:hypothetical protein